MMLVRLWLSKYWNAVYLLTLVLLCFQGCIVFIFPALCVLVRTVRVRECAAVNPELNHLETVQNKTKTNKTYSDTQILKT